MALLPVENLVAAEYSIIDHRFDELDFGARWTARGIVNMQRRAAEIPIPLEPDAEPQVAVILSPAEDYAIAAPYIMAPPVATYVRVPLDANGNVVTDDHRRIVSYVFCSIASIVALGVTRAVAERISATEQHSLARLGNVMRQLILEFR